MSYLQYALQLTLRNRRRTLTYLFGLVLAVGLFSGILFFVDASASRMTQAAIKPVAVDMQVRSTLAHPDLKPLHTALLSEQFVKSAEPVIIADFTSISLPVGGQTTTPGKVFVLQPSYYAVSDALKILSGSASSSGVMISQTTANDLGLSIGDPVAIYFDQLSSPYVTTVSGVVDPSGAYFLFASTDPAHEGEYNPVPYDIFITPDTWEADLAVALTNPVLAGDTNAKPVQPQKPLYELHVETDHTLLPADPTKAGKFVDVMRRSFEKQFPGEIKITNNLADALKQAKSDILWAKLLFLFLGMPGVTLAAYLSKYATDLLTGPQKQEIGLLRARGASPRQILLSMGMTSFLIALVGTILGILGGLVTTALLFGAGAVGPTVLGTYLQSVLYAFVAGLVLTGTATYLPVRATLQEEISHERRQAEHKTRPPFWARAYLDIISLVIAGIIFWIMRSPTTGIGFTPTDSESSSLALGFFVFLAPFFMWVGLTLTLSRILSGGVSRGSAVIKRMLRSVFGDLGQMAGKSITRRAPKIASAVVIVSLALSFGVSLGVFINTYQVQKTKDARFSLGSDVKVTVASGINQQSANFSSQIAQTPGVEEVSPVQRVQAYVGSSLQTVFGINPQTYPAVSELPESFFVDQTSAQTMSSLANTPNGVLVSQELASAYNILVGDPVIISLPRTGDVSGPTTETHLQAVGIIRYFPTAQQDAFLVMNQTYLENITRNGKISYFLVRTNTSPSQVAGRIEETLGKQVSLKTENIDTAVLALGNSMTSLNLRGLGKIEQGYSVIIISLGLAIFLLSMIYERAREFGAMRAVGGSVAQLKRILWSESLTVGVLSLLIGSIIGLPLGKVFVSLLKALYTIPPKGVVIPWVELAALMLSVLGGMGLATLFASRRLARMDIAEVLREL